MESIFFCDFYHLRIWVNANSFSKVSGKLNKLLSAASADIKNMIRKF